MKIFRGFFLASIVVVSSFAPLHAMEQPSAGLKTYIFEVKYEAEELTEKTGVTYNIVTKSKMVAIFLNILGLSDHDSILDIRYHYELMKKKLSNQQGLVNVVTTAYNQLIPMISEVEKYQKDIQHLLSMSFKDLELMEIGDDYEFKYEDFFKRKNKLIDSAIASLKKQYPQYVVKHQVSHQLELPLILQTAFKLPANASPYMVDEGYKKYVRAYKNYTNRLVANAAIGEISIQDLKHSLAELEEVDKAYKQYVQQRDQK